MKASVPSLGLFVIAFLPPFARAAEPDVEFAGVLVVTGKTMIDLDDTDILSAWFELEAEVTSVVSR